MIKFDDVSKVFKPDILSQAFVALDHVSFNVPENSMVGFLGANGAGKTTSFKIIMDFIRPSSGEVQFSSTLGMTKSEIFRNLGFLPERPYFYPHLTGQEFLSFMGEIAEVKKTEIGKAIAFWAPRFKIDHALNRELKTYSKGMLQRIGFLAAILHDPKLILLDEPLSGLDPIGRKEIKDVIIEIHKAGKTVFFSSHIVPDIEEICDRVIFLKEGKLVYDGSVQSLLSSHTDQAYLFKIKCDQPFDLETPYKLRKNLPENLSVFTVSAESKNQFLNELSQKKLNLIGLEAQHTNLEEIFYRAKA